MGQLYFLIFQQQRDGSWKMCAKRHVTVRRLEDLLHHEFIGCSIEEVGLDYYNYAYTGMRPQ
jgi:hypothetical protein